MVYRQVVVYMYKKKRELCVRVCMKRNGGTEVRVFSFLERLYSLLKVYLSFFLFSG